VNRRPAIVKHLFQMVGRVTSCAPPVKRFFPGRLRALACSVLAAVFLAADRVWGGTDLSPGTIVQPGSLPDAGSSVLRLFGALALVIAIFFAGVWLYRNWQRFAVRHGGAPRLNVMEVKSLGQRQALYVVGYEQQRMLLASSPAGVTLLAHLPEAEAETSPAPLRQPGFAEAFRQVLTRKS
jgi:flagellar biogenesis protein FliO